MKLVGILSLVLIGAVLGGCNLKEKWVARERRHGKLFRARSCPWSAAVPRLEFGRLRLLHRHFGEGRRHPQRFLFFIGPV